MRCPHTHKFSNAYLVVTKKYSRDVLVSVLKEMKLILYKGSLFNRIFSVDRFSFYICNRQFYVHVNDWSCVVT